ncbi:MAG: 50S ribosomal protein L7ae [Lachnospiraceae bacterium]|nr:50S ribosomal protein L7ae [Lachnospiraceae bacterium]
MRNSERSWKRLRTDRVRSLLSLAMKAGKLVSGEFLTEKAVKTGKATLVIAAEDASDNTKKMFTDMCTYYKVPLYFWGKKEDLGAAIGREYRASVALTDAGFRDAVVKQIKSE